ncbi:hypothetical protein GTY65_37390 [Streptomyces sp. SID8379]|uniref:hypothetical protein n=1 Tax=unclassified Streptomyces TaxID=2593676 RepID=UPI00035DE639|nr:hypothetical protein [Streptomyces sp. HmicA12]MYW69698.1 hypothetical protein [Streptomyces sp. SID8379]
MQLEQVDDAAKEERLYRQLYAGLPVAMPDPSRVTWPAPSATVAAREDDALLGWVVFFAHPNERSAAILQWIVVERERERIAQGHNTEQPVTEAELRTLEPLVREAAEQARAAGYSQLEWFPAEPGFAEGLADLLEAQALDDDEGWRHYRLGL